MFFVEIQRHPVMHGVLLAIIVILACWGVLQPLRVVAQTPLFSVTLIVPSGANQVRRDYANTIVQNMIAEGIDAKLVITNFDQLSNRLFGSGSSYSQGGYDMGFIGWGFTGYVPDFEANLDGRPGFLPPAGSNYAFYNSPTVNALFDKLRSSTDTATQVQLTHEIQEEVFKDAPYNYIYESIDPVPRASKFTAWGSPNIYSEVTFPDVQHWGGSNSLTMAEASNVFPRGSLNPAYTSSSNTFYAFYIWSQVMGGALQEPDPRCSCYIAGTAQSITSSPDGLTWTVKTKPGVLFQDGVEVTADDFVYTQYALTNSQTGSVSLASNIQYLGSKVTFTYLDGTSHVDDNTGTNVPQTDGWWKATSKYEFQFHIPAAYPFTSQVFTAFAPLPKHIMEKFPFNTWESQPFSTASGSTTYTWDKTRYGGSGSYTAVGPVGAGAYSLQSYDFTNNIATLVKFPGYWNASGLQALGQFSVNTYKVEWINSKTTAIAALGNGQVDLLDYNFALARDRSTLQQMPNLNVINATELGWQEMGFNLNNPVFGTGVNTPLGKSNPSQAADAARNIRKAISHLIPRQQIVNQLLAGSGYPLASFLGPGWGVWYDPTLSPDTYDLGAAADDLRAAGYSPLITATASTTSAAVIESSSTSSMTVVSTSTGPIQGLSTVMQASTNSTQTTSSGPAISIIAAGIVAVAIAATIIYLRRKTRRMQPEEKTNVY